MESNSEEEPLLSNGEAEILFETHEQLILDYVQNNIHSTNTKLFSILALLNAYVPESYLCMEECQQILGPPNPIDGGPPFEERMDPFINLVDQNSEQVCYIHPVIANRSVELLVGLNLKFRRSVMAKDCMMSLCGGQPQSDVLQFIKDLLTRREMGENGKEKFSRLILDIMENENFDSAAQLLQEASHMFQQKPIFPRTVARLYCVGGRHPNFREAEKWAKKAIKRARNNSHVADTLGQVYKNSLRKAWQCDYILKEAERAFRAFRNVEEKAENEEGQEMNDMAGAVNISTFFNNRGLFGFIQVVNIITDKLSNHAATTFFPSSKQEVEIKFNFFEWYLCYSKPDMTAVEPDYFWKDVVRCYECYTDRKASDSTSFPGLLDCLNHGLFTSKGRRAGFYEVEKTKATLEAVRDALKADYEENHDDVEIAERYILSNIILNNKMPSSPQHSLVRELQRIISSFPQSRVSDKNPEFYLLALLLFWPENQLHHQHDDGELRQQASENEEPEDTTWDDEEVDEDGDTEGELEELSPEPIFGPDLQEYVALMEGAFDKAGYAKYLRGRYLLPLFFLGKGAGLSKWVHKSRLDAIVERKVDDEYVLTREKKKQIDYLWISGKVWHMPEIRDLLLPVQVEPSDREKEMSDCVGGKEIKARIEDKKDGPPLSPVLFYLALNIRGPVVFKVEPEQQHNKS